VAGHWWACSSRFVGQKVEVEIRAGSRAGRRGRELHVQECWIAVCRLMLDLGRKVDGRVDSRVVVVVVVVVIVTVAVTVAGVVVVAEVGVVVAAAAAAAAAALLGPQRH